MRDVKGLELIKEIEEINQRDEKGPEQPGKCHRCVWGEWNGTVQFCSKLRCIKE